ncbi:prolyl 4-hydroxylase subunit alpha-2-like [Drosophila hydei]|uniref:procollagen-proline 4-dioxygenase n=1 Tax=Drosophila hydei TaxID=7224 RepID=A0A6J1LKK0_DROHY|nr:prolyl 4-hydroxylase subunit alpha-2-like [Drosophila hydei]
MQLRACWKLSNVVGFAVLGMLIQSINPTQGTDELTSLLDKLHMLKVNRQLMENLNEYVNRLHQKLDTLRRLALELEGPLLRVEDPESEVLSNPLLSYSLVRQMHFDWPHVEKLMEQSVGLEQIDFAKQMRSELPRLQDVMEATAAMNRVQQVYQLEPADVANGLLDEVQLNAKLSISDCYEMGANLFEASQFSDAASWLIVARELWDQSLTAAEELLTVSRSNISSLLARSEMAAGHLELARAALLEEPSLRAQAEQLLLAYRNHEAAPSEDHPYIEDTDDDFIELCDSSYTPRPTRLVCSYKTNPSKFLHLAPFKMELLSEDPYMVVFHDVLYDEEIESLRRMSEPSLSRSLIVEEDGTETVFKVRTANDVFLDSDELSPKDAQLVKRIYQRLRDLTELRLGHASFEYLKYDFGGHYTFHHDYLNDTDHSSDDRVATFLIYLNDVTRGGATVFSDIKLAVHPEKGKVLHWYNMNPSSFDFETRSYHGACPVLIGRKIALARWIHEQDQMFVKPCLQPPLSRKSRG